MTPGSSTPGPLPEGRSRRTSSRQRYREYRRSRREGDRAPAPPPKAAGSPAPGGAAPAPTVASAEAELRPKRNRPFRVLLAEFWKLLRGSRARVAASLATLTVAALLVLAFPACTKIAIDYILTDRPGPAGLPDWLPGGREPIGLLWQLGALMVAITFVRVLVGMWGRWQMTRLTKRVQSRLRRRVFEHAVRLPLHRVQQIKSGGVSSVLRDDAGGAGELLFSLVYNPWNAIVQLVGALVTFAVVDARMLLGAVVLIPVVWLTHRTWIARIRPRFRDIRATRQAIDAHATEAFGGIRVVRGFARQRGEAGRFVRGTDYMTRQEVYTWWWSRGIDIAWSLLIPTASVGVLLYCGSAIIRGTLTLGDMMMFSALLMMLLSPLEVLATSAAAMQTNLAGFDRVLDLLAEPVEFADARGSVVVGRRSTRGRVTLRDVTFTYPGGARPTIRAVSLDVAPGETIALVGPSGSGKTTLCNLVARFYDPQEGRVELDGTDLRDIDVASYRRLLGIVEQDVFLFDGTVAENIAYSRPDASPEHIAAAARAANAADFIDRLDRGYATVIGERGVKLSGGQKQRLAIARALLADPRILILDEATSNLDTESERLIQKSLTRLMRGRTCFVIAHRLSTVRHASRIVVVEDGRLTEVGTHEELMAKDGGAGRYAYFLRLQTEGARPEEPAGEPQALPAPVPG